MKINYEKLNKKHWFEDANGNKVEGNSPDAVFYRRCFPLELHDKIDDWLGEHLGITIHDEED